MITEDAEFTVAAKRQRTPVIAELLLRPDGPPPRYRPGQYVQSPQCWLPAPEPSNPG